MEKPSVKSKNKFLALLPKAAKAAASLRFEFENPLFSPGREYKRANSNALLNKHKPPHHQMNRGHSGPITSSIFQKAKNSSRFVEPREPTSPTISCIGQVKCKKRLSLKKQLSLPKEYINGKPFSILPPRDPKKKKAPINKINDFKKKALKNSRNLFSSFKTKSDDSSKIRSSTKRVPERVAAPGGLSQMKKFASSRDTLSNFDWTTATAAVRVVPEEKSGGGEYHRRCYSDDEGVGYSDGEEEEDEIEVIVPYSATLEPKKEINLWKRRTMAQPKPLQLNKHHGN